MTYQTARSNDSTAAEIGEEAAFCDAVNSG